MPHMQYAATAQLGYAAGYGAPLAVHGYAYDSLSWTAASAGNGGGQIWGSEQQTPPPPPPEPPPQLLPPLPPE